MLSSVALRWQCNSLIRCVPLIWQSVCSNSSFQPHTEFLRDVKREELQAKYADIVELQSADERVRKVFTVGYGDHKDVVEKKITDLIDKIVEKDHCRFETVSNIVKITVNIKYMQEKVAEGSRKHRNYRKFLFTQGERRQKMLDDLRDNHFETYAKAIDVLEIRHRFNPQHDIGKSPIAQSVRNMRVRAFAESRRLIAAKQERESKLQGLQEKFRDDLLKQDVEGKPDHQQNMEKTLA